MGMIGGTFNTHLSTAAYVYRGNVPIAFLTALGITSLEQDVTNLEIITQNYARQTIFITRKFQK
jgi:hypothetical protein